jgi:hypothetical protein
MLKPSKLLRQVINHHTWWLHCNHPCAWAVSGLARTFILLQEDAHRHGTTARCWWMMTLPSLRTSMSRPQSRQCCQPLLGGAGPSWRTAATRRWRTRNHGWPAVRKLFHRGARHMLSRMFQGICCSHAARTAAAPLASGAVCLLHTAGPTRRCHAALRVQ